MKLLVSKSTNTLVPLKYFPLWSWTVKVRTTMSTLTRNVGLSWAQTSSAPAATAINERIPTRFDMDFLPENQFTSIGRCCALGRKLYSGLGPDILTDDPQ